jgi:3-dehydroquinate dehydratase II
MAKSSAKTIYVLMGPNLNMLGQREPEIYGRDTYQDLVKRCERDGKTHGFKVVVQQSNHEGDLVTWIQDAMTRADGLIINAAAYTHTSVSIHDALRLLSIPVIEVHLSNTLAREPFRHHSFVAPVARAVILGCGAEGYSFALQRLSSILEN